MLVLALAAFVFLGVAACDRVRCKAQIQQAHQYSGSYWGTYRGSVHNFNQQGNEEVPYGRQAEQDGGN